MCETNVYLDKDGEQEVFMKDVVSITPQGDTLLLVDLFGEQKQIKGQFKELQLLEHSKRAMKLLPEGSELVIVEGEGHGIKGKYGEVIRHIDGWLKPYIMR